MIDKISNETKEKILNKTAYALPDNPSAAGFKPADIKKAFYRSQTDCSNSLISEINRIVKETNESIESLDDNLIEHSDNNNNPHLVTKSQVGLGNCDNTSDLNKPISIAQQNAFNSKLNITDVVDSLDSSETEKPLSANKGKELYEESGNSIEISIDNDSYVLTVKLKNHRGELLNEQSVDLPLESVVVSGRYDETNKKVVLSLKNGETVDFSIVDLIDGLVNTCQLNETADILSSAIVEEAGTRESEISRIEQETQYKYPFGIIGSVKTTICERVEVTTVNTEGKDYAYSVVANRLSRFPKENEYEVTFDDISYRVPCKLGIEYIYDDAGNVSSAKLFEYLGNINLFSNISPMNKDLLEPPITDIPFLLTSDVDATNQIALYTTSAGTHAVKIEKITVLKNKIPNDLIYGQSFSPISKYDNEGSTFNAVSIGPNFIESGRINYVVGDCNYLKNVSNFVLGQLNIANKNSYILGLANKTNGDGIRFVFGRKNTVADGDKNFVFGNENKIQSGNENFVYGELNEASANLSVVIGIRNKTTSQQSTALGVINEVSGAGATAVGYSNKVSGNLSNCLGIGLKSQYEKQTVLGKFNNNKSDNIFEIGNGTNDNSRANAVEINSNGDLIVKNRNLSNVYLKTDTMESLSVENTNGSIKLNDTNFSIKNENGGLSIKPNQFVTDLKQINGDYLLPKSYTRVKDANGNVQAYYGFNNDAKMVVGSRNNNVNIIQGQIDASNQTDLKTDNAKHVIEMEDNGSLTIKSKSDQDLQIRKYVIDEEDSGWNEANIMSEINFNADFPEMQLAAYENGGQDKNNGKIEIRSDKISIKLSEDFIDGSKKTGISMNRGNIFIETAVDSGPCIHVNDNGVYLSRVELEENRVATKGDVAEAVLNNCNTQLYRHVVEVKNVFDGGSETFCTTIILPTPTPISLQTYEYYFNIGSVGYKKVITSATLNTIKVITNVYYDNIAHVLHINGYEVSNIGYLDMSSYKTITDTVTVITQ